MCIPISRIYELGWVIPIDFAGRPLSVVGANVVVAQLEPWGFV